MLSNAIGKKVTCSYRNNTQTWIGVVIEPVPAEKNYCENYGRTPIQYPFGKMLDSDDSLTVITDSIQVRVPFVNKVETFRPVGIGAYPYECIAKDKHPDSMIYVSEAYGNGWIASHQLIDTGLGYFELGVA